jgi:hypothetical protein
MFSVFSVFSVVKKFEPQKHTEKAKTTSRELVVF